MSKMIVELKVGETLEIGSARVRLEKKSGQVARLVVEADDGTRIKNPQEARRSAPRFNTDEGATHHG